MVVSRKCDTSYGEELFTMGDYTGVTKSRSSASAWFLPSRSRRSWRRLTLLRRKEAPLKADWNGLGPDQGSAPKDRSGRGNSESRISAGRKLATDGRQDLDGVHGGVTWTMSWTLEHRTGWFSSSNALVVCSAIGNEKRRLPRMRWGFLGRVTERAWSRLPRVLAEPRLKSKPFIN